MQLGLESRAGWLKAWGRIHYTWSCCLFPQTTWEHTHPIRAFWWGAPSLSTQVLEGSEQKLQQLLPLLEGNRAVRPCYSSLLFTQDPTPRSHRHFWLTGNHFTSIIKSLGAAGGKEPAHQCRRHKRCRFYPGLGRSPGEGHGNPLQYSYLENPMDRGAWRATVHRVTKSRTWLKQLSTHTCMLGGHLYGNFHQPSLVVNSKPGKF